MNLTEHFTLEELIASVKGSALGIDNTPSEIIAGNLKLVAEALEEVRAFLIAPLHVNSGYRCPLLNAAVGGAHNSRHMLGLAADFIAPDFGTPLEICRAIVASGIVFDQLIYEHTWVHLGLPVVGDEPRRQVLTLMPDTTYAVGIVEQAIA